MSGIGIITNPHSKLNKRNPQRQAVLGYILGERGTVETTSDVNDLERVAAQFLRRQIHTLAINGGDGTISRTLTAFVNTYGEHPLPRVAILKGGTINVLANNLGIKGTPERILYRLVEQYSTGSSGNSRIFHTLCVDGYHGFLFGTGTAAAFLKEYYKRKSGPIGAAYWAAKVWGSRFFGGPLYDRVVQDHTQNLTYLDETRTQRQVRHHTSLAVFCSTVPQMPLGYPMFRLLKTQTELFQAISFPIAADKAYWQLPATLVSPYTRSSHHKLSFGAKHLIIEQDQPFEFTVDGELFTSQKKHVTISLGPAVEFVTL